MPSRGRSVWIGRLPIFDAIFRLYFPCKCCLVAQVTFMSDSVAAKEALESAVSSVVETKRD